MFSFLGLTQKQCEQMIAKHHIYMTLNGRISIAGLTTKNVDYVANAIKDVTDNS
jgi:aspartate/tyrosine/aromatic aminotransferase